jgi:hypothetical protein
MTAERILLSLHLETRARLDLARLPLTESRTKWINAAICQRLDRENPETIGKLDVSKLKPTSAKHKTPRGPYSAKYKGTARYSLAFRENMRRIRADGRSPGIEWLIERSCIQDGKAMSQEEKDAVMEGSAPEPFKSTPIEEQEDVMDAFTTDDSDFWGETTSTPKP